MLFNIILNKTKIFERNVKYIYYYNVYFNVNQQGKSNLLTHALTIPDTSFTYYPPTQYSLQPTTRGQNTYSFVIVIVCFMNDSVVEEP